MRKYEVIGPLRVYENDPGEMFEKDIPKAIEKRLLDHGHLRVVTPKKAKSVDAPSTD